MTAPSLGDARPQAHTHDMTSRLNVHRHGVPGARPVVLLHGFGCDQRSWRHVVPHLVAGGHEVVTLDLMGAGGSDLRHYEAARYASLAGHADDVVRLLAELDLDRPVLVAHSVSSMIGALVDAQVPGVLGGLVMIGPSASYIDDPATGYVGGFTTADIDELLVLLDDNYLGWSAAVAPMIMGRPDEPALGVELTDSFCRADPAIARQFAHVTFRSDHRADLAHVTARTLVLQCAADPVAPPSAGLFVHAAIAGSTFGQLAATGHVPNLSAPHELAAVLLTFLDAP